MSYDILELTSPDETRQKKSDDLKEDRRAFTMDPDIVYPATIERIRSVIAGKGKGEELFDGVETMDGAKRLIGDAKKLKKGDLDLALIPLLECESVDIVRRYDTLELVRKWAIRSLKVAVKKPIWIHIPRRIDWKLT